jgi:pyrophosphatase PpaX
LKIRAVLFDLDGTLLDSIEGILHSFRFVLGRHAPHKSYTREHLVSLIGEPVSKQMSYFADGDGALAAQMVADYRSHNRERLPNVPLFPLVRETLAEFRRRGFLTGIVTSKQRASAMISVDTHRIGDLFDLIVTSDDTPKHKPDPMPLLHAAERLGVATSEITYVGDSVHDIRCALGAGSVAVGALWGPFPRADLEALRPHHLCESLASLQALPLLAAPFGTK